MNSATYQRILVAFDGSEPSLRGLDEAIKLSKLAGAKLRLVHVLDALNHANGFETVKAYVGEVDSQMHNAGNRLLDAGVRHARDRGVDADTMLVDGSATPIAELISEHASIWNADLIVSGTHGRRGIGRLLMGSDAEQILRAASVPVLLVKGAEASEAKRPRSPN